MFFYRIGGDFLSSELGAAYDLLCVTFRKVILCVEGEACYFCE